MENLESPASTSNFKRRVPHKIHQSAIVHPNAKLGTDVFIGPFCKVGENAVLGDRVNLQSHVVIDGHTTLGSDVEVHPFAVIGAPPQHTRYAGEPTTVSVGDRTVIRENVTINRGTPFGTGTTIVGHDTFLMAYCHIAHDCVIGNHVIMANACQMAGHVVIGDHANIGGISAVIQHCRVGKFCYVGGGSMIRKDLPPFVTGKGNEFNVQGINRVGLTRSGASPESVRALQNVYKIFYLKKLNTAAAVERIRSEYGQQSLVKDFLDFVLSSKTGFER